MQIWVDNYNNYYNCAVMDIDFTVVALKLKKVEGKTLVFDPVRKKWLVLTPEEHVRQYILQYFIEKLAYPASLIAIEKKIDCGHVTKRFDIVVYNRDHEPWLLVECKAPDVPIDEKTLNQLLNYQRELQSSFWLVSNGHTNHCADARNINDIKWMDSLPIYDS